MMDGNRVAEIKNLVNARLRVGIDFVNNRGTALAKRQVNEESELPGYEDRRVKFGQFENQDYVAMMTDIRGSTGIINGANGTRNMFLVFYAYSAVVANITDRHGGTATEFLGDGVINLFQIGSDLNKALIHSMEASLEILDALKTIINPIFKSTGLPEISMGIGIDYGNTIVTRFGYKGDNDLKALGPCVYNAAKLCKGQNDIRVSTRAKAVWPSGPTGTLQFRPIIDPRNLGSPISCYVAGG